MNRLTLLYDAKCGFCVTCRHWLGQQPKFLEMDFVPARSALGFGFVYELLAE